jgi:hypothetical protein
MKSKKVKNISSNGKYEKIKKQVENIATVGLLLIAVALLVPLFSLLDMSMLRVMKWVYCAGALIFTCARVAGARDDAESMRVRRLHRMEFWGGVAFIVGAAFWFYNESRLGDYAGPLGVIQNTILFALVGATIQVVATWLIYFAKKKENNGNVKD